MNEAFLTALESRSEGIVFQFSFGAEPLPHETGSRLSQRSIAQLAEMTPQMNQEATFLAGAFGIVEGTTAVRGFGERTYRSVNRIGDQRSRLPEHRASPARSESCHEQLRIQCVVQAPESSGAPPAQPVLVNAS